MSSVNEILVKINKNHLESKLQLYLYGDPSINNSDNKKIILSAIKFIKETQRFSTYEPPKIAIPRHDPQNGQKVTSKEFVSKAVKLGKDK